MRQALRHLQLLLLSFTCALPLLPPTQADNMDMDVWRHPKSVDISRFVIDKDNGAIIIAAKNFLFQLSLDLQELLTIVDVTPDPSSQYNCVADLRDEEDCHNYHYVLLLSEGNATMTDMWDVVYNINETILVCGSYAFSPVCQYRARKNISVEIRTESGNKFCPYNPNAVTSSLWTSNQEVISGTPVDAQSTGYGISISDSPFSGRVGLTTVKENAWFNKGSQAPEFVSMYEIGDYVYAFFREEALETSERVLYSRVSRVCKNDPGAQSVSSSNRIFTTFLKARMSCVSGTSSGQHIPYYFNDLRDTFYLESGSYDGSSGNSKQHMYAIFTSPENGPTGSAVCVYTFGSEDYELGKVFEGDYLREVGLSQWEQERNYDPVDCATGRTAAEAENFILMSDTARQSNGDYPLMQLSGYTFQKIVVDTVTSLSGSTLEVMFIAGHHSGELVLLKSTYSHEREGGEELHVSETFVLEMDAESDPTSETVVDQTQEWIPPEIMEMQLYGSGSGAHIYISTSDAIYRLATVRCEQYIDCCQCVSSMDPYCAWDTQSDTCIALDDSNRAINTLIQDVIRGDFGQCLVSEEKPTSVLPMPTPPTSSTPPTDTTQQVAETTADGSTTSTSETVECTSDLKPSPVESIDANPSADPPSVTPSNVGEVGIVDGLTKSPSHENHTWTIVGSVSGFIGGVVLGIIVMAIFYNRRNFWWSKLCHSETGDKGAVQCKAYRATTGGGGASNYNKDEEFRRNNSDFSVPQVAPVTNHYHPHPLPHTFTNLTDYPKHSPVHVGVANPTFSPKRASVAPETHYPPRRVSMETSSPYNSPYGSPYRVAASAPRVAGSALRVAGSTPRVDPNIKSNIRREEALKNHQREAYGQNIIARAPSVDASRKSSKHSNGHIERTLPVSYNPSRGFVQIHDSELGCTSC